MADSLAGAQAEGSLPTMDLLLLAWDGCLMSMFA